MLNTNPIYNRDGVTRVLVEGRYRGLSYYVLTVNGDHPTAYINIGDAPEEVHANAEYAIDDTVHGGITYDEPRVSFLKKFNPTDRFIGWDYAHYGDFCTHSAGLFDDEKIWTQFEINQHCQEAIDAIYNWRED